MENRYLEVVKEKSFITAMTSLQVAEITGKEHRNVTADIEDEMSKLGSEISPLIFQQSEYTNERGRKYKMYNLSRDGAMQLGARYDATTRYRMIQRINELETFVKQDSYTIADPVERAKRWIEEQEEKKALELKVEVKEQIIQEYKPRIEYLDTILNSSDTMTISQIAADYGISAIELNRILHEEKIQRKVNKQWLLYTDHMNKGWTKSETIEIPLKEGKSKLVINTKWTQKGRVKINEILNGLGVVANMDKELRG
ncbi:MAG: phage antirepressor KilAC domain-containing protein [Cetobacterium sp.]|uniref:phage antirepressor KilAC domain-containing protein n=1 Tax=Cetobacterium sp. TaxID=2071632 RepID=UPI003F387966